MLFFLLRFVQFYRRICVDKIEWHEVFSASLNKIEHECALPPQNIRLQIKTTKNENIFRNLDLRIYASMLNCSTVHSRDYFFVCWCEMFIYFPFDFLYDELTMYDKWLVFVIRSQTCRSQREGRLLLMRRRKSQRKGHGEMVSLFIILSRRD